MLYQALCISTKNQQGERYKAFVCHVGMAIVIPCYAREEGSSLETAVKAEVSNHPLLLR